MSNVREKILALRVANYPPMTNHPLMVQMHEDHPEETHAVMRDVTSLVATLMDNTISDEERDVLLDRMMDLLAVGLAKERGLV